MSWEDREYADDERGFGRPGGDWQGIRPSFDNPMSWAISIGRVSGIQVRVHVIFLVFVLVELGRALNQPSEAASTPFGFGWAAVMCAAFFGVVLLHEFGHCLACRARRGEADEILMWPLGGLAYCRPRDTWVDHLVTVVGGPLVNVGLLLLITPIVYMATGRLWGVGLPHPFDLGEGFYLVNHSPVLGALFLVNWVSLVLLLFNLLPIFPLDGGRIVQALLWSRTGYAHSMRIAVRIGYVGAIGLGVAGWIADSLMLVVIAGFGGLTCYHTLKQVQYTEDFMGFDAAAGGGQRAYPTEGEAESVRRESWLGRRQARRAARELERQNAEDEQVDAILRKIQDAGIGSLSGAERRLLRRATERRKSR